MRARLLAAYAAAPDEIRRQANRVVHESGGLSAPARIFGGRADVRRVFYMAAVTASRHNPLLKPFYDRLIAAGKPPKVALIAVMRRLVVFANAVLRSDEP